jgi:hypothetical protein
MSTMMIAIVPIGWAALAVGSGIWRPASRDAWHPAADDDGQPPALFRASPEPALGPGR